MHIKHQIKLNKLFKNKNIVFTVIIFLCIASCTKNNEAKASLTNSINLDHFNHLYKEIELNGKAVGIVHIYSEYSNYDYKIEPNESYVHVPNVVFSYRALRKDNGDIYIYYGGNDTVMNVAITHEDILAELCEKYPQEPESGRPLYSLN